MDSMLKGTTLYVVQIVIVFRSFVINYIKANCYLCRSGIKKYYFLLFLILKKNTQPIEGTEDKNDKINHAILVLTIFFAQLQEKTRRGQGVSVCFLLCFGTEKKFGNLKLCVVKTTIYLHYRMGCVKFCLDSRGYQEN